MSAEKTSSTIEVPADDSPHGSESGERPVYKEAPVLGIEVERKMKSYLQERSGISHFFKEGVSDYVDKAVEMAARVMKAGCKRETALELSLLALYDLVLLVDNSVSMETEQGGERIETLKNTLESVSALYQLVSECGGITALKFLNQKRGYTKVKAAQVKKIIDNVRFQALTRVGTELRNKVLLDYAKPSRMTRPLLVIIITDGEVEGEPDGLLQKVIRNKAIDLNSTFGNGGAEAVAYQFATIGDDPKANLLVQGLDDDEELGDYIDCMPKESLESIKDPDRKWMILGKLFLGAICPWWDDLKFGSEDVDDVEGKLSLRDADDDTDDEWNGSEDEDDGDDRF